MSESFWTFQDELKAVIEEMKRRNICNILALRGDAPEGVEHWEPAPDGLEYCYQLIKLIRTHGDDEGTYKAGVEFVVEQCNGLLEDGAPGLHFYSLNKVEPTREILSKIRRNRNMESYNVKPKAF